ncbi:MAG: hypothetical protein H7Z37_03150 [Pyrinomonadaceae bacterium]|nr:hypothetical protein [Pyrinomonadaceae bacterium]
MCINEMNFIEFLTIYLAIGAAFGAHYYLYQRRSFSTALLFQTLCATVFWVLYAAKKIYINLLTPKDTRNQSVLDSSAEIGIESVKRDLQTSFINLSINDDSLSYFRFNETVERYVGLSLALQNSTIEAKPTASETETFRISGFDKHEIETAGRCLHRKNFLKLQAHQAFARQEIAETIESIADSLKSRESSYAAPNLDSREWREFQHDLLSLFEILSDKQTKSSVTRIFDNNKKDAENAVANKSFQPNAQKPSVRANAVGQ